MRLVTSEVLRTIVDKLRMMRGKLIITTSTRLLLLRGVIVMVVRLGHISPTTDAAYRHIITVTTIDIVISTDIKEISSMMIRYEVVCVIDIPIIVIDTTATAAATAITTAAVATVSATARVGRRTIPELLQDLLTSNTIYNTRRTTRVITASIHGRILITGINAAKIIISIDAPGIVDHITTAATRVITAGGINTRDVVNQTACGGSVAVIASGATTEHSLFDAGGSKPSLGVMVPALFHD